MDNNDSNIKPQQTGGLKLMTVFIAVLALHVVVIGGFTVYHLMSGGSTDTDLTSTDKIHKSTITTDTTSPDATQPDKSASASATTTDVAATTVPTTPTPAPAPAPTPAVSTPTVPDMSAQTATTVSPAPAIAPATVPAPTIMTPKLPSLAPPPEVADLSSRTPSGPIVPDLAPPAESAPAVSAPIAPVSSLASGPVHMPATTLAPTTPKVTEREHHQIYTVKITDSYKKIAKEHHVTVAELKEANHIKGDVLHTGQKLIIPSGKTAVAETTPAPASTPSATTTSAVNTSLNATALSEPAPAASSTASLSATPHSHTYTVVKGDTLSKIAHKFKTTPSAIMAENSISDPTKLTIGKKLKIPSRETRSAKNTAPAPTTQPIQAQPSQVQAKESAPAETTSSSGELATFVP
jgi:LysM repeat protein